MRSFVAFLAMVILAPNSAFAQCKVSSSSNEGKLLAFYVAPLAFAPALSPEQMPAGAVRIGFEAEYLPKPSAEIQRTGKCFLQKSEHTSISPVFGRPRVTIGLPGGFAVEASYLPPIKIADAKPNMGSVAISRDQHFETSTALGDLDVMGRAHATFGNVKGPITCPKSSLQTTDASKPCYGTTPSNDTFHPEMFGAELVAGIHPGNGLFQYYAGAGANRINPHFQVGFTDGTGHVDHTQVQLEKPATRVTLLAGVTSKPTSRLDYGLQVYSAPADATTFRFHAGLSFR